MSESPSPSPSSNHSLYTYTPTSNNQTGIQFDNDLPRSLNIFFICLILIVSAIILCLICLFVANDPEDTVRINLNRRGERAMENIRNATRNRRINRRYERRMENRRINRQSNANLTYVYPSTGNDSREEVNINYTYPSPVRSNNYNVRNNTLPLSLPLEDRIELYNEVFNSNGNQLILKNKHIVSKINASKSDIEVCLDIELDASKDNFSNDKKFTKESNTVENSSETKMMTRNGTCSICIDVFIEHDQIVYSELCSHVYHKHCMVSYLATNAQREIRGSPTLDVTDNPCPSCRKNYCQIRDEDLTRQLHHWVQPAAAL